VLFAEFRALKVTKKGLRPRGRTLDEMERAIHDVFKDYLDRPAAKLDRDAGIAALDELVAKGSPVMAHRAAAYMSTVFGWAIERGKLKGENPFRKMPYASPSVRDRVLADWELRAAWKAVEAMGGAYGAIVRLAMLLGQRREEISGMRWSELSPDRKTWTIPKERAKNGVANTIPLPQRARDIIAAQAPADGNPHVFPARRGSHFGDFTASKARLDKASGATGWTLHDLRRTAATNWQKIGVGLEVSEALLNHVSGSKRGVAGIYHRYD
jgi:integrase